MQEFNQTHIPYRLIAGSAPVRKKKRNPIEKFRLRHSVVSFIIFMVLFLTARSIIQIRLGLYGVAVTELMMPAFCIAVLLILRMPVKEAFPIRKPAWTAIFGTALAWFSAVLFEGMVNQVLNRLFPLSYRISSRSEDQILSGHSSLAAFLIICILPAVCEEMLHRGLIQTGVINSGFSPVMQAVIMGIFFALFHINPILYPAMFILGGTMSLIRSLTGNMVYSSLLHFLNNLVSLLAGGGSGILLGRALLPAAGSYQLSRMQNAAGRAAGFFGFFITGIIAAILFYLGIYLVKLRTAPRRPEFVPGDSRTKRIWRIFFLFMAAASLILGIIFTALSY